MMPWLLFRKAPGGVLHAAWDVDWEVGDHHIATAVCDPFGPRHEIAKEQLIQTMDNTEPVCKTCAARVRHHAEYIAELATAMEATR